MTVIVLSSLPNLFFQYDWFLLLSVSDLPLLSIIQALMDVIKNIFPSIVDILFVFNLKNIILGALIATWILFICWLIYGWFSKILQRISVNVSYEPQELEDVSFEDPPHSALVEDLPSSSPFPPLEEVEDESATSSLGRVGMPGFTRLSRTLE